MKIGLSRRRHWNESLIQHVTKIYTFVIAPRFCLKKNYVDPMASHNWAKLSPISFQTSQSPARIHQSAKSSRLPASAPSFFVLRFQAPIVWSSWPWLWLWSFKLYKEILLTMHHPAVCCIILIFIHLRFSFFVRILINKNVADFSSIVSTRFRSIFLFLLTWRKHLPNSR